MDVPSLEAIHEQMEEATERSNSDHYCWEELSEDDMWYENVLLPAFQKHETLRYELQPGSSTRQLKGLKPSLSVI